MTIQNLFPKALPQKGTMVFIFDGKILASAVVTNITSATMADVINNPRLKFDGPMVEVYVDYRALGFHSGKYYHLHKSELHEDYESAHQKWLGIPEISIAFLIAKAFSGSQGKTRPVVAAIKQQAMLAYH